MEIMKMRVQIALTGCLLSIFAHLYLTFHYYPLKFGFAAGQSICNLNATFDCDAVSASSYSSLFGMPLSVWGGMTNLVLFLFILIAWLEWTENPERLKRGALALSGLSVAASLVMGGISFGLLQSYCLFCIGLYAMSLIIFFSYKGALTEPFWPNFGRDLKVMTTQGRSILIGLAAIPAGAYLVHHSFMQNLGDAQLTQIVQESVAEWQSAPANSFVAKPSLIMGPSADQAVMTLAEFADFRCSHCRHASYSLDAFAKSHPDVRFEFYSFPLDGACNEKIESSSGISCRLAQAVYCAAKDEKGWSLHHALYDHQDEVNQTGSPAELDVILSKQVAQLGLNWSSVQNCIQDPATQDAIRSQAKQGALVNVMGTPTIFVNGKLLNRGQLLPVLEAVHSRLEAKKAD
jgi:protein-disulfide isomerase/uncharacterized membrane protein